MDGKALELDGGVVALGGREGTGAALYQSELPFAVGSSWIVLDQGKADAVQPGCIGENDCGPGRVEGLDDLCGE